MSAFSFGGVDTGSSTYGLSLLGPPSTMGTADPKTSTMARAGDGVVVFSNALKNSRMTMECAVTATSQTALWRQMDALRALLDSRNGEKLLVLDFENSTALGALARGYYAILDGPIYPNYYPVSCTFQLNFLIPSGVGVGATATTRSAVDVTSTIYEPATAGQNVGGTTAAHPVWLIKNTGDAATGVTVTNVTTGQVTRWVGTLATGAWLRLDAQRVVAERSVDSGANWTNVTSGLTAADSPVLLVSGARNEITVTGLTAGTLDLSYRTEYL